jgi:DNA-binding transcriptional ArsR family regulator
VCEIVDALDLPQYLVSHHLSILRHAGAVKDSGLKDVKLTVKALSGCIDPDTKDPLARSILDSLGGAGELSQYVVSVYVEARK